MPLDPVDLVARLTDLTEFHYAPERGKRVERGACARECGLGKVVEPFIRREELALVPELVPGQLLGPVPVLEWVLPGPAAPAS